MYTNINPTATEPWRQLVEVLKFHEDETIRFHIESKDGSMFIAQTIPNMKHGEYEGHEKLGHIISISSTDIERGHANITLHKENIIKVKWSYPRQVDRVKKDYAISVFRYSIGAQ
ncbi:hypothetical protein [Bacillus cereus]|jgi:hypothetical protein